MTKKMPTIGGRHVRNPRTGRLTLNQKPTEPAAPPEWPSPGEPKEPEQTAETGQSEEGDKA